MKAMNLQGDAHSRAHQIAAGALKSKWRDDGRKLLDFRISDHRKAIGEYLAQHPEIVTRAAAQVAEWRKNRSANTAQKNGSLNPKEKDNESCNLCQGVNDR